jgi:hypothetical protein
MYEHSMLSYALDFARNCTLDFSRMGLDMMRLQDKATQLPDG